MNLSRVEGDLYCNRCHEETLHEVIYLEDEFGVRTEDTIVVHEDGCENLTQQSHELISI